jgi:DNA-binding response OmpR family regulator
VKNKPLHNRLILVIEDDYYQAEDVRDYITLAGGAIVSCWGVLPNLDELLKRQRIDVALLDINLGDKQSFDLARDLSSRHIPFVFLTGYDSDILPKDLCEARLISKPAVEAQVIDALVENASA